MFDGSDPIKVLQASFHIGVWSWEIATGRFYWDASMNRLYGRAEGNFSGSYNNWLKSIHPGDRARCDTEIQLGIANQLPFEILFRVVLPSGELRNILGHHTFELERESNSLRLLGMHIDVTKAVNLSEEKFSQTRKMSAVLKAVGVGVWDSDLVNSTMEFDDTMYQLYGFARAECPNPFEANERAIHPDDRDRILGDSMARIQRGESRWDDEFRVNLPDGSIRYLSVKIVVKRSEDGTPIKMSGANFDITPQRMAERASRIHQARFETAANAANDGIWDWNLATGNVYYSSRLKQLLGFEDQELPDSSASIFGRIHPDDNAKFLATVNPSQDKCNAYHLDLRLLCKNGQYKWFLARGQTSCDEQGNPLSLVGTFTDISAFKFIEEKMRQTHLAIDSSAIVVETDLKGIICSVNDKFCELSGYSRDELIGQPHSIVNSGYHDQAFFRKMWSTIKLGLQWSGEIRNRKKDGSVYWVQTVITPMNDPQGKVCKYLALRVDISNRKEIEAQLFQAQDTMMTMLNTVPIGIAVTNSAGELIEINPAGLKMLGYASKAEMINLHFNSFFHDREDGRKFSVYSSSTGSVENFEILLNRRDGSNFWATVSASSREKADGTKVVVISAIDLTERRKFEAQLVQSSKMASLGEMAAGVAHEINTPLAIIVGKANSMLRLLNNPKEDLAKLSADLNKITQTAMRIAKIVKGLSTFSRSGERDSPLPAQASSIVDCVLGLCQERFRSHGVKLIVAEIPKIEVNCRETQVTQVLLNLLNNSFDAVQVLSEKWVQLEVLVIGSTSLQFIVTDSGSGIPESVVEKLMQPFFTTKAVGSGTGLGLSISRGIAADHGGSLSLDQSSVHTRFVLDLPLSARPTSKQEVA